MNPSESLNDVGLGTIAKREAIDYLQTMHRMVTVDMDPILMMGRNENATAQLALGFVAGVRLEEIGEADLPGSTEDITDAFFQHVAKRNSKMVAEQGPSATQQAPLSMVREYADRVSVDGDLLEAIEDAIDLLAADLDDDDGERT